MSLEAPNALAGAANMSGNCLLRIMPIDRLATMVVDDLHVSAEVTYTGSDPWLDIPYVQDTLDFMETEVNIKGGVAHRCVARFEVAKDTLANLRSFSDLKRKRWLCEIRDNNGERRLLGGLALDGEKQGALLKVPSRKTHDRPGLRNGYICELSITRIDPAYHYREPLADTAPDAGQGG